MLRQGFARRWMSMVSRRRERGALPYRRGPALVKWLAAAVLIIIIIVLRMPGGGTGTTVAQERPGSNGNYSRPKLVLILVIDQFRYDYLTRFRPYFAKNGFTLLLSGANFTNCRYDYASTATCPGHATLFTGAYPSVHGIISNEWYDPSSQSRVYCASDSNTTLVGAEPGPGFSPRRLMGTTLGDELRIATDFESKVIAISLKDRASVMPGGHTANAAYWYDAASGHFVTSTYYMDALPAWVSRFNDASPAKPYCGQPWKALSETPGAKGKILKEFASDPNESCPNGRFLGWLDNTPFMNEIELNFVLEAVKNEHLGRGPNTDLLAVSLSVNDYIGHSVGPYSPEVADTTLRTDRYLEQFLHGIDRGIGLQNVWIALTADHGVAPNPQFIEKHRLGPGKLSTRAIELAVERALSQRFGEGQWVQDLDEFYINLNPLTIKKFQVDPATAAATAAAVAASVPGVRAAYPRADLMAGRLPHHALSRKLLNSFSPQRSGDVFLVWDAFAVPVLADIETAHGSPWNYDAQVPLVLWGSPFRPGNYADSVQPTDLVATLASLLGLTQPSGAEGHPLTIALK